MKLKVDQMSLNGPAPITTRCPQCGKLVILEGMQQDINISGEIVCGQRRCPDSECRGHLFVVMERNKLIASYPAVRIDFDSTEIPSQILKPFEEALDCHAAGYYTAAAIMIRRTLEAICDEKKAEGKDLKARIRALGSKVIIPQELLEGMDELRLLGNDAAHVNAESYIKISEEELRVAIEFAKEILKALYQYTVLLEKLRALKGKSSA